MAYVKNAKGRVVSVPDERAEYLLDPNPTYTDDKGKKIPRKKSKDEEGFTKPTAAEVAEYRKTHAPEKVKKGKGDKDEEDDDGKDGKTGTGAAGTGK